MAIADFLLNTLSSLLSFGVNLLPVDISFFTVADLSSLLASLSNFWKQTFSISSHFFPFALFFTFLILILLMELTLFFFKIIKYVINVVRGSGG